MAIWNVLLPHRLLLCFAGKGHFWLTTEVKFYGLKAHAHLTKTYTYTLFAFLHVQKIVLKICANPIRRQIFTTAYGNNVTCSMVENLYYNLNLCNSSDFPVQLNFKTIIPKNRKIQGCLSIILNFNL